MAHLRGITHVCDHWGCESRAVVQVFTNRNDPTGRYCNRHAKSALAERQKLEDKWAAEERAQRDA